MMSILIETWVFVTKKRRFVKKTFFQKLFFYFHFILPCQRQHSLKTSWFFVNLCAKTGRFLAICYFFWQETSRRLKFRNGTATETKNHNKTHWKNIFENVFQKYCNASERFLWFQTFSGRKKTQQNFFWALFFRFFQLWIFVIK